MIKVWADRIYLIFAALAVAAQAIVLSSFFLEFQDYRWLETVFLAAIAGFLNFTMHIVALYVLLLRLPEWLTLGYQILLSMTVLAIIGWGLKRGWRTKALIMILLTAPATLLLL